MVEAVRLGNADSCILSFSKYVKSYDKGEKVNNLFALNFAVMATNSILMPVRESLTLEGGKLLQTRLMMLTVLVSITGQAVFAYYSGKYGGLLTLRFCFYLSSLCCIVTYCCLMFAPDIRILFSSAFYLWFTFYNMTSMSTFWAIAGDVLEERPDGTTKDTKSKPHGDKIGVFSHLAAGGTLGHMIGSSLSTVLIKEIGTKLCLVVLGVGFFSSVTLCTRIENYQSLHASSEKSTSKEKSTDGSASAASSSPSEVTQTKKTSYSALLKELRDQIDNVGMIWDNPILRYSFLYSIMQSTSLGLTVIERTIAAKSSGLNADEYGRLLAGNQTLHGALQFLIQFFGSGAMIALMGSSAALSAAGMARFCSFIALFSIQAKFFPSLSLWYISSSVTPVTFVIITDLICRLVTQTISKPVRESLWGFIPKSNKYRSKIIVDVLAHRIGTSLAAFLANVPLLYAINQIILSSPLLTSIGTRTFSLTDFTSVGLQGQDHIVWGVFATTLFITSAVYLGTAVQKAKQKTE